MSYEDIIEKYGERFVNDSGEKIRLKNFSLGIKTKKDQEKTILFELVIFVAIVIILFLTILKEK
jgi:hypothetical protein